MKKIFVGLALMLALATSAIAAAPQIDLNTATVAELTTIKGIGNPTAIKIIAGRPYTGKDQLLAKKIVSPVQYAQIRDFIVAKKLK